MKQLTPFIISLCFSICLLGQEANLLPLHENGKIMFREVVSVEGIPNNQLHSNAEAFVLSKGSNKKKHNKKNDIPDSTTFSAKCTYKVFQKTLGQHPDGEIRYNLTIEVKEMRYRYTMTNFVFHPYKRNRYGKYELIGGKSKELEDETYAGKQNLWDKHRRELAIRMEKTIANLKTAMVNAQAGDGQRHMIREDNNW